MGHLATRNTVGALAGVSLTLTLMLASCTQPGSAARSQDAPDPGLQETRAGIEPIGAESSGAESNGSGLGGAEPAQAAPAVALGEISPGIHNLFAVAPGVFSGSGPEDAAAFDGLRALGVKTVISVDGARPELELAHERGMRYVHIPIGYDGMDPEQEVALAKALRDMPGPVYVHCHHGKHRGPTAAAVGLLGLGRMSGAEAEAFMHAAGTSESYPGLWACAAEAQVRSEAELDMFAGGLPEVQVVSGLVDTMVAIDKSWERIKLVRAAGWAAPADHPDLSPAAEAGMLADHFRVLLEDPAMRRESAELLEEMRVAANLAATLEASLVDAAADAASRERAYQAVAANCTDCHEGWRN